MQSFYWLVGILLVASIFGLYRRWDEGRTKVDNHHVVVTEKQIGAPLGEKATLLQFSLHFAPLAAPPKLCWQKLHQLLMVLTMWRSMLNLILIWCAP